MGKTDRPAPTYLTTEQTWGCWSNHIVKGEADGLGFNDTVSTDLEPFRRQLIRLAA